MNKSFSVRLIINNLEMSNKHGLIKILLSWVSKQIQDTKEAFTLSRNSQARTGDGWVNGVKPFYLINIFSSSCLNEGQLCANRAD